MNEIMTNKLRFRKFLPAFLLVTIIFLAFSSFYVPPAQAVFGSEDIFFEYGAESGVLHPPWDIAGGSGTGSQGDSYVQVDNTHVMTSDEAVKFYIEGGAKDDRGRRIILRKWETKREYFLSAWCYFPTDYPFGASGQGSIILATNAWFGPSGNRWKWLTTAKFYISSQQSVMTSYRLPFGQSSDESYVNSGEDITFNKWFQFQIHAKWETDTTGQYEWFFGDSTGEIYSRTVSNIKTDPEGYAGFTGDYAYAGGVPYPSASIIEYVSTSYPEIYHWVDDIVGATERIPETYRVNS